MSTLEKLLGEGKLLSSEFNMETVFLLLSLHPPLLFFMAESAQNVLMETEMEDRGFTLRALAEKITSLAKDQKSMADVSSGLRTGKTL